MTRDEGQRTRDKGLKNKLAQIFLFQHLRQLSAYISAVDAHVFVGQVRRVEADLLDYPFQDRVQPAGADVLRGAVDLERHIRQRLDAVRGECQPDALCRQQLRVLLRQGVLRLGQDAEEVVALQVGQFDADRKSSLKLRHQIGRLG